MKTTKPNFMRTLLSAIFASVLLVSTSGCFSKIKDYFACQSCPTHVQATTAPAVVNAVTKSNPATTSSLFTYADDGSKVLVELNNGAKVTEKTFRAKMKNTFSQMMMQNGATQSDIDKQLDMIMQSGQQGPILESALQTALILLEHGNQVEQDPEFVRSMNEKKELEIIQYYLENARQKFPEVSDSQVKDYYNKNRHTYIKTPGGMDCLAAKFTDVKQAEEFYNQAQNLNAKEFEAQAQNQADVKFSKHKSVSKDRPSSLPTSLVGKVANNKSGLPHVEFFNETANSNWVVMFTNNKETELFGLEEIKPRLKVMMRDEVFASQMQDECNQLRKKYIAKFNLPEAGSNYQDALDDQSFQELNDSLEDFDNDRLSNLMSDENESFFDEQEFQE